MDSRKKTANLNRNSLSGNIHLSNKSYSPSLPLVDHIHKVNGKFSDPAFLPIPSSIKRHGEGTPLDDFEYDTIVARWIRPEQIRWPQEAQQYPLTVFNQPHARDIIQGRLGNCWFTSALSLIAEVPQILYKVMITKAYNPAGLYKVRLCNRGLWQVITIDDLLPVTESNSFVFSRSPKRQLFAALVEKALAKLHGSYKSLDVGRCVEGLQTLTGEPCEVFFLRSNDPQKQPNLNQIWAEMIQSKGKGYLMTCVSSNTALNEAAFNQMGLEFDHAYSILDVKQVHTQKLVCLRNPWGKKEQNISSSSNWKKWPEILQEQHSKSLDNHGIFWMPWEQMSSCFSDITICKVHAYAYKVRKQGAFSDFSSQITSAYSLDCPNGAELDIELFNAGDGKNSSRGQDCDIDLFVIVLSSNGASQAYKHGLDYYTTLSTTVPPGRYIVLAGSLSVLHRTRVPRFNLVVHSSQPFFLKEQSSPCKLVGHAFHAVALRANNRKHFGDGVSILTFNDNGGFGFICENTSKQTIRLTSDFQGSMNVIPIRKAFRTVDIIPAKTKQLFAIFVREKLSDNVQIVYQVEYQTIAPLRQVDHVRSENDPPMPSRAMGLFIMKRIH